MSDGNTAIPVGPIPTESEMNGIRSLFDRAANAIVDASKLAVDVAELRKNVEALRAEIETVRASNRWLDEQLVDTRKARDEAREQVHKQELELHTLKAQNDGLASAKSSAEGVITHLNEVLEQTRKDRDDAQMQAMELQDNLDKANAKLAKFKALFEEDQPKPEAKPDLQTSGTEPVPTPASTNIPISDHSEAMQSPAHGEGYTDKPHSEPDYFKPYWER